jgi:hypothetical protein
MHKGFLLYSEVFNLHHHIHHAYRRKYKCNGKQKKKYGTDCKEEKTDRKYDTKRIRTDIRSLGPITISISLTGRLV